MRDELLKKLDKIENLEDRKLLKSVLLNVFDSVAEHNMVMYETLRENIYNEIEDSLEKYYIYTTVDYRYNIDPISNFYHPMCEEDARDEIINLDELSKNITSGEQVKLATIFMEMNLVQINDLINKKGHYNCVVETENNSYNCKVYLQKSNKYINKIEELYRVFQFNEKEWKTVNYGYAHKFLDVFLSDNVPLERGEQIKEIRLELGEYDRFKKTNLLMFWNVKKIQIDDKSFPKPLENTVHYEHSLDIESGDRNCGFLVDTTHNYIKYLKQTDQNIIVANNEDTQDKWDIVQIENSSRNILKNRIEFKELTNKRNLGFIGRFANEKALIVRTRGELSRLFQSYDLSNELSFYDVEIREKYIGTIKTIDFNYFMDNNLRDDPKRSFMVLKFRSRVGQDFMIYEKLSFFTSVAGLMFPEYKCIGELV